MNFNNFLPGGVQHSTPHSTHFPFGGWHSCGRRSVEFSVKLADVLPNRSQPESGPESLLDFLRCCNRNGLADILSMGHEP